MENVTKGASGEDKESSEPGRDEIIIVITEAEKRVDSDEEEENTQDDQKEVKLVEDEIKERQIEDDEVDKPAEDALTGPETVPNAEGSTTEASLEHTQANSEQNTGQTEPISELIEEESDQVDWEENEDKADIPRVICVDYIRAKSLEEDEETPDYGYTLETVAEDTLEGSDKDEEAGDDDDDEIPVSLVDWDGPIQEELDGTELADSEFEFTRWSGEEANNIEATFTCKTTEDDQKQNQDDPDQLKGSNEQELKMVDRAIAGLETAEEYIEQETTFDHEKGQVVDPTQADVRVILTTAELVEVDENLEEDGTEVSNEDEPFGQSYDTWKRSDKTDRDTKTDTDEVETEREDVQECRWEEMAGKDEADQTEVNQEASWEDVVIIVSTVEEVEPTLTVKDADWAETISDEPQEGEESKDEETTGFDENEVELNMAKEEVLIQEKIEETCDVEVGVEQRIKDSEKKVEEEIADQNDTRESVGEGKAFSPAGEITAAKTDTDLEKTRQDLEILVCRAERAVPDLEKARRAMEQEKLRGDELNTELKLIKEELTREKTRAQEEKERADRAEAKFGEARKNMEEEKAKTDLLRLNLEQQKSKADRVETDLKKIQKTVETEKARSQGKKRIETEALEQARRDIEYEKIRAENAEAEMKKAQRELETIEERYLGQRRIEAETVLKARRDAEYEKARANRLRLELRTLKENKSAGKDNEKDSQAQQLQSELENMRCERDKEKARADRLEADMRRNKEDTGDDASNTTKFEQTLKTMKQEKARADRAETYFQQARRECEQEKVRAQLEKRRADRAEASVEQKQKHLEQEKTRASRVIAELKETKKQLDQEKLRCQQETMTPGHTVTQHISEETNANTTTEIEVQKLREQLERERARADRAEEEANELREATTEHISLTEADKLKLYVTEAETELERARLEVEQERARTELVKEELEKTVKDFKMEKLRVQEEKIRADLAEAELRKIREKESRVTFRQELEKVWDETKAKAKVEARLSQTDLHLQLDSTTWDGYKLETSF